MVAGCGVPVRRNWGLKCPPKLQHGEQHEALTASIWPTATHPQSDLQTSHALMQTPFLEVEEVFPEAPPQYLNDLSDVYRRQMRKSQRGGAAGGCTQHCKHTSICRVRVCRYVLGFHSVARLLIDWYFHYGHRVVWRMLICLGVLQVYNDCSGARRKGKLMKLTEPNHNLWVKINWLIII